MEKNKKDNEEILNAADFLAIGDDFDENQGVMIDGQVISDHSEDVEQLKKEKEEQLNFEKNKYYDKKSFKRMGWGLWLAENRKNITKVIIVLLIAMSSFFFIYSIYNLIVYFKSDNPIEQGINNNLVLENKPRPVNLRLSGVTTFSSSQSDDLLAIVKNDNNNYYSIFSYCFIQAGNDLNCQESFVFPGEEKYIFSLGIKSLDSGKSPLVELRDVSFKRVDNKQIPDFELFKNERLNFPILDLEFSPASSKVSNVIDLNNLKFTIVNESAYGYYEMPLNILVYNGQTLIGVNRYIVEDFKSGQGKDINISWPGDLRNANRVEIIPDINIFLEDVYSSYKGD